MNTSDIIEYKNDGFNNAKYLKLQTEKILERIDKFRDGKLYLETGGKFIHDPHAARVLPGFHADIKKEIFRSLRNISEILFCTNAKDIQSNRQLNNTNELYTSAAISMLRSIEEEVGIKPRVVINRIDSGNLSESEKFANNLNELGYITYKRYQIDGYPHDTDKVLSEDGFGKDDYITTTKKLIVVIGAASNSGKMSTCLGQIYMDKLSGIESGYAKYETFPIWSLPIEHPVNLAYEAATADIGDFNVIDSFHEEAYGKRAVNYNRDVEAFEIIKSMSDKFLTFENFITSYKSPTDMGINYVGMAIENDEIVCIASLREIVRRKEWYAEQVARGDGDSKYVEICKKLESQALNYINVRGFDTEIEI